jgi:hypothetical protein
LCWHPSPCGRGGAKVQFLLGLPPYLALAAVIPLGVPARQLRRLTRKPVQEFAMREHWGGESI